MPEIQGEKALFYILRLFCVGCTSLKRVPPSLAVSSAAPSYKATVALLENSISMSNGNIFWHRLQIYRSNPDDNCSTIAHTF